MIDEKKSLIEKLGLSARMIFGKKRVCKVLILFCFCYQKAETPRATRVLGVSVIAILKKSRDRLPTQETENASGYSSQHLKNVVISRFSPF